MSKEAILNQLLAAIVWQNDPRKGTKGVQHGQKGPENTLHDIDCMGQLALLFWFTYTFKVLNFTLVGILMVTHHTISQL